MLLIARRTAVGAALLLIMPAVVWISGWKWHPELSAGMMKLLYWEIGRASCRERVCQYV